MIRMESRHPFVLYLDDLSDDLDHVNIVSNKGNNGQRASRIDGPRRRAVYIHLAGYFFPLESRL